MKTLMTAVFLAALPALALAHEFGAPDTVKTCPAGQVWDEDKATCIDAIVS